MLADRNIEDTLPRYLRKGQMETNKQRHLSCLYDISLETQIHIRSFLPLKHHPSLTSPQLAIRSSPLWTTYRV